VKGTTTNHRLHRAGVPQVILPVWYDTYDSARRVEYLGVGLWGSKTSAPAINGPELGKALTRVLHSEESSSMQEKAKSIASKLGTKEGRVVAYEKMIEVMDA
jgi:UDP:flavonoid glycosyltransferase YjiC (YdhE family)